MARPNKVVTAIDNLSFQKIIEEEIDARSFGLLPQLTALVFQGSQLISSMGEEKTKDFLDALRKFEQDYIEERKYLKAVVEILYGFRDTSTRLLASIARKEILNSIIDEMTSKFGAFKTELVILEDVTDDEDHGDDKNREIYDIKVGKKVRHYEVALRYSGEKNPYSQKELKKLRKEGVLKKTIEYCINNRDPRIVSGHREDDAPEIAKEMEVASHITVPLYLEDQLLAYLHSSKKEGDSPFTADNGLFFELMGNSIALALRNNALYEQVRDLSMRDPLTRLYNRRVMAEILEKEINRVRRSADRGQDSHLSIMMIDLDHFKQLNDNHGHQVGDYVLQDVSSIVLSSCRNIDSIVRYGGEEFMAILPMTPMDGAIKFGQKVRKALKKAPMSGGRYERAGLSESLGVTASMGIATFDGKNYPGLDELISAADDALYHSKKRGRDCISVWRDDQPEKIT